MRTKSILFLAITLCVLLSLCSCGSSSELVGNWVCDEAHSGYPDQMTLNADGTGTVDGFSCSWTENDGELVLNVGSVLIGVKTYDYSFSGSKLYLDGYSYTKK